MNFAPIGIITYSRITHLKKTIESLKENDLAKDSELYIFLDAPKTGDEVKVQIVRDYIYTIDGFRKVYVIERATNGLEQNSMLAFQQLFEEHGKCIFMEDDNVVSKQFLQYMNDGLEFYKDDKSIFAINGFNVPVKFKSKEDFYKSKYFHGWGIGIWSDRGLLDAVKYKSQYIDIKTNKELYQKIKKVFPELIKGLKQIHEGTLDAGDYKIVFHMIKNDLYVIKPTKSLVDNIGNDGSGVHCGISDRFENKILNNKKIEFKSVVYNKAIDTVGYKYLVNKNIFTRELPFRIYRKIKRLLRINK